MLTCFQTVNSDPVKEVNSDLPRVVDDGPAHDRKEPVSLRALLTRPVVVSVVNYGVIALLDDSRNSDLAHLVDAGEVWRAQHESSICWFVDGRIYELHLSVCRLSRFCQALRPAECRYCQHPLLFPNFYSVPLRESGVTWFD